MKFPSLTLLAVTVTAIACDHSSSALSSSTVSRAKAFVNNFNDAYESKHHAFEEQFWGTKMALKSTEDRPFNGELLSKTKQEMEDLLSDVDAMNEARSLRGSLETEEGDVPTDLAKALDIIIKTGDCYTMPSDVRSIRESTTKLESELELARNGMKLGYTLDGEFHEVSSVALGNTIRTSPDEATRRAAFEGLKSVGPFVCNNGFVDIVKQRNRLAKQLGFVDYYDMKVTNAEGFGKDHLFEILDGLEKGTKPLMEEGRKELVRRFGKDALKPWNMGYMMAGSVVAKMDPYFPFSKSVERYIRSFSALNVSYAGATMNLDLLDRPKKYSNGFCHWPECAWRKPDGTRKSSVTNFTSLADPSAVGSGMTALTTLMHEAGHAAHMANVDQPSPLFAQERAPTSVAYAENQSMFLDSLVGDAAWRAKYARNSNDEPIPFEIIEEEIRATHPFKVFQLRNMLAVSYFEKALYELPEEEVTAERMQSLADEVEERIQGGPSPRPILSVPHIVSDESSCYYQGYTLAEMSVHQTRKYFKDKYGYIVDNPNVGPTLTKAYWEAGNSRPFLDLVKDLTGTELSGDSWTDALKEDIEEKIKREKLEYDAKLAEDGEECDDIDLDMTVRFVDGDTLISDSSALEGGLLGACKEFEEFVASRIAGSATATAEA